MKRYEQGSVGMRPDPEGLWCDYAEAQAEIERLRGVVTEYSNRLTGEALPEIERLRAYIAEIEKWKDEGERIIGPAAEWGPGGNVMVQSSVFFKLGAWWADRPWRVHEALGE